jgi:hypothetical protein
VYGRELFANSGPAPRARAWRNLLWISVLLNAAVFAVAVAFIIVPGRTDNSPSGFERWVFYLVVASTLILLVLLAYIGDAVFIREGPPPSSTDLAPTPKLGLSLLAGGVMMLCSLVLDVGYTSTGLSVVTLQGLWVTAIFIPNDALAWLIVPMLAAYVAGIVLALLAVVAGVMALLGKPIPPKRVAIFLNASVVIFWFTLTNYWFDCFYLAFVGISIFGGSDSEVEFAIVTAAWLTMFVVGTVLWFRFRNRTDDRGVIIRTALVLWALPLMPLTIATFWYAASWSLYGLILYVAGLQIVTACCWKMWRAPTNPALI